jgi:hypothetical protein
VAAHRAIDYIEAGFFNDSRLPVLTIFRCDNSHKEEPVVLIGFRVDRISTSQQTAAEKRSFGRSQFYMMYNTVVTGAVEHDPRNQPQV